MNLDAVSDVELLVLYRRAQRSVTDSIAALLSGESNLAGQRTELSTLNMIARYVRRYRRHLITCL